MDNAMISNMTTTATAAVGSLQDLGWMSAITTLVLTALFLRFISGWRSSPTPPSTTPFPQAPTTFWETLKMIGSVEAPFFLLSLARRMGTSTFRLPLPAPHGVFVVADPELARAILQDSGTDKPAKSFAGLKAVLCGNEAMAISPNNEYAKTLRKAAKHAFTKREVERMQAVAQKHVQKWLNERLEHLCATEQTFDPAEELTRITFGVICEAAFEYEATEEDFTNYVHNVEMALREFTLKQTFNPIRKYLGDYLFPSVREARDCTHKMAQFLGKVAEAYRNNPNKSDCNTLIKILMEQRAKGIIPTDDLLHAEMNTWIFTGHDTTGFTLSNAIVLLAQHPKVQDKLRKELLNNEDAVYYKHVQREANRLIPVAAVVPPKRIARDFEYQGKVLPKGALCFLSQYVRNHNARVYGPNADEFQPERWENATPAMKDANFPFDIGQRACPGQALANVEINALLPELVKSYQIEVVKEGKLDFFLSLKFSETRLKVTKIQPE